MREESGKRHNGCRHWGIGKDGRIWNPRIKTQCKGSVDTSEWWKVHIPNRRWNGKVLWRRSGSENIHFDPGKPRPRRRTRKPSKNRIRRIFNPTSRLIFVWWWSWKWFLYSTEMHRFDKGWRKYRRLLERWWRSRIVRYVDKFHKHSLHWVKNHRMEKQGPGGDWQGNLQARQIMARDLERYVWRVETQRKAKVGVENPKLNNSRKLRGIHIIDPDEWFSLSGNFVSWQSMGCVDRHTFRAPHFLMHSCYTTSLCCLS